MGRLRGKPANWSDAAWRRHAKAVKAAGVRRRKYKTRAEKREAQNAKRRKGPGYWTKKEVADLKRWLAKGLTAEEVAAKPGVVRSAHSVNMKRARLVAAGEVARRAIKVLPEEEREIARLCEARLPKSMIARKMGMKLESVSTVLRRLNLKCVSMAEYKAEKLKVGFVRGWLKAERGDGSASGEAI